MSTKVPGDVTAGDMGMRTECPENKSWKSSQERWPVGGASLLSLQAALVFAVDYLHHRICHTGR